MRDQTKRSGIHATLLNTCVRAWALGKPIDVNMRMNISQARALSEVIAATDALREACVTETSLDKLVETIEKKKASARSFEEAFSVEWPI